MDTDNGIIEFFSQHNEHSAAVTVRLPSDASLPEVLEAFEGFLKAAGYQFNGQVDIILEAPQDENAELN